MGADRNLQRRIGKIPGFVARPRQFLRQGKEIRGVCAESVQKYDSSGSGLPFFYQHPAELARGPEMVKHLCAAFRNPLIYSCENMDSRQEGNGAGLLSAS